MADTKKSGLSKIEPITEQSKKIGTLASSTKAPVASYKDRRQQKKAVEITEKRSANEIMEAEIKKLEEEKKQSEKRRIANLLSNSDEEDDEL